MAAVLRRDGQDVVDGEWGAGRGREAGGALPPPPDSGTPERGAGRSGGAASVPSWPGSLQKAERWSQVGKPRPDNGGNTSPEPPTWKRGQGPQEGARSGLRRARRAAGT